MEETARESYCQKANDLIEAASARLYKTYQRRKELSNRQIDNIVDSLLTAIFSLRMARGSK